MRLRSARQMFAKIVFVGALAICGCNTEPTDESSWELEAAAVASADGHPRSTCGSAKEAEDRVLTTYAGTIARVQQVISQTYPETPKNTERARLRSKCSTCAGKFLFGAAVGLANWLDASYPETMDASTKGLLLQALLTELRHLGWYFTYQTTENGWPLFIGGSLRFMYIDASNHIHVGTATLLEHAAMHRRAFDPTRPGTSRTVESKHQVDPWNPYFDAATLVGYVQTHGATPSEKNLPGPSFDCGASPFALGSAGRGQNEAPQ